jgi:RimJ/RimL family protein N-acetyltransferase
LERARVNLVRFTGAHVPALVEMTGDRDVQRHTRTPIPVPTDFGASWLARYEQGRRHGTREAFAIVDSDSQAFLGIAVAPRIDRNAKEAELGYVVAPAARGRGVATEALRLLTEWAFAELGAMRLELLIGVENEASKRVAARCGYVKEGVLRSLYFKQDLREDTEIWSRLPSDPDPG